MFTKLSEIGLSYKYVVICDSLLDPIVFTDDESIKDEKLKDYRFKDLFYHTYLEDDEDPDLIINFYIVDYDKMDFVKYLNINSSIVKGQFNPEEDLKRLNFTHVKKTFGELMPKRKLFK